MLRAGAIACAAGVWRVAVLIQRPLLSAVMFGLSARPLCAQAPQHVQALAEQAIRRLDLQTELLRKPEPFGVTLNLPPETIWVAVVVGIAVLLYAFRDMIPVLRAGHGGAWPQDDAGMAAGGTRTPAVVLGAADELAAAGRFAEAMHVLLLQALAEIRRQLDQEFADSMTSREILRSNRLSDDIRHPLRDVVSRVEWTYFGQHAAAEPDYFACRSSFGALATALQKRALA
ncbi:MAG: hypothetical protein J2P54_06975 [Bradyrhizobiaceae bacterium]|nr:hypothetical protein [Bradyrhizobiaceae bacterium]